MTRSKQEKSRKLIQLRDKLAKMNNYSKLSQKKQKAGQIMIQNQVDDVYILEIICENSKQVQQLNNKVAQISKKLVKYIKQIQKQLVEQLQRFKQHDLQKTKEYIQNYIAQKKKKSRKQNTFSKSNKLNGSKDNNSMIIQQQLSKIAKKKQSIQKSVQHLQKIGSSFGILVKNSTSNNKFDKQSQLLSSISKKQDNYQEYQHEFDIKNSMVQKLQNTNFVATNNKIIELKSRCIQPSEDSFIFYNSHRPIINNKQIKSVECLNFNIQKINHQQKSQILMSSLRRRSTHFIEDTNQQSNQQQKPTQKINHLQRVKSQQILKSAFQFNNNNIANLKSKNYSYKSQQNITNQDYRQKNNNNKTTPTQKNQQKKKRGNWMSILKQQQAKYAEIRQKIKD